MEKESIVAPVQIVLDAAAAARLIEMDHNVDRDYKAFVRSVLDCESSSIAGQDVADRVMTMINLAKALERITRAQRGCDRCSGATGGTPPRPRPR